MTRKHKVGQKNMSQRENLNVGTASSPGKAGKSSSKGHCFRRNMIYAIGFAVMLVYTAFIYGDVFARAEQESFATFCSEEMKFLTSQAGGYLLWGGRILLLAFKNAYVGGVLMALVLTVTAMLLDKALGANGRWKGISFVVPTAILGYFAYKGTNLYFTSDPAFITLLPVAALVVAALAALGRMLACRKKSEVRRLGVWQPGWIVAAVLSAVLYTLTLVFNQNQILLAKMQNALDRQDWQQIIDYGTSAKRPNRPVAAYYAIALVQTNQLLEKMLDIYYDYPLPRFADGWKGLNEQNIYLADCNFYAGLINSANEAALDRMVMQGPRVATLKRLALCAIMNQEKALAKKYLALIADIPFEQGFVDKYAPMADNFNLVKADAELSNVMQLFPMEKNYEQNYRQPAFLGYNVGLQQGTDATLTTSLAACLYSKDLNSAIVRMQILAQKRGSLPNVVQQAIVTASLKNPQILQAFPGVSTFLKNEAQAFLQDCVPYLKDKKLLAEKLRDKWLGTYYYYYYCQNNYTEDTYNKQNANDKKGVN